MTTESNLFAKGPLTRQAGLSEVLERRKQGILNKIKRISDLDQMTDAFLEGLVKESLVQPPVFQFDKMTRKLRDEQFDGSAFPGDFNVVRGRRYPKQVARISIPFSGDGALLEYTPNQGVFNFPKGDVCGDTIQFDVILWGYDDDAGRVKDQINDNRKLLELYSANMRQQVKQFNESLPQQVKAAFTAKLDELTKQHAIFDDLGIAEEPEPPNLPSNPIAQPPKKGKARAVQIIQIIDKMYVQQLNQTNNNMRDVNNAIQSN
jgi:hypothetical protein